MHVRQDQAVIFNPDLSTNPNLPHSKYLRDDKFIRII